MKNLNFKKTFELRIIKNNSIFHKKNIFFVILLSCALSIPLHSATKRKKGETKIPINPLSQKRESLKDDMETTLSTAIQNSITKGGYISVLKDKITILEIFTNQYLRFSEIIF